MKNILFSAYIMFTSTLAFSQAIFQDVDSIDVNNINAAMGVHGNLWHNPVDSFRNACEFPKGSGKHIGFAGGLWMGAMSNGSLLAAAQTASKTDADYWPGPIVDIANPISYSESQNWARVWKVSRDEINQHLSNATHTVSNTPAAVLEWPAQGNSNAKGKGGALLFSPMSNYTRAFAPFVDVNNNGTYEPLSGDYPDIKGDQALWAIFNDYGPSAKTISNSETMGLEIHCLAYAYKRNGLIDNVIFYEYQIINRLGKQLDELAIGFFSDLDIGYSIDDYVGYDSSRNLSMFYNATPVDGVGQPSHYGSHIPLAGVRLLEMPDGGCSVFKLASSFVVMGPSVSLWISNALDVYSTLKSEDWSGNPLYGGTKYAVKDDAECVSMLPAVDQRAVISSLMSTSLLPGQLVKFSVALVASDPDTGHACPGVSFASIQEVADTALEVYCNPLPIVTGIAASPHKAKVNLYPNPVEDQLYVDMNKAGHYTISISDVTGRVLLEESFDEAVFSMDTRRFAGGVYTLTLRDADGVQAFKFVKK